MAQQLSRVETFLGVTPAGLHPATGGDGSTACSADMLLQALVACAGVTLGAVATSMGITVRSGRISATGVVDFRGTLGVSRDTDATPESLAKLLELSERYCVRLPNPQTPARAPRPRLTARDFASCPAGPANWA